MAILAQPLFALVRSDLVPLPFFSARHIEKFMVEKKSIQFKNKQIRIKFQETGAVLSHIPQDLATCL